MPPQAFCNFPRNRKRRKKSPPATPHGETVFKQRFARNTPCPEHSLPIYGSIPRTKLCRFIQPLVCIAPAVLVHIKDKPENQRHAG